ncbi:TPA: helix-turn-helix transcriptional regulator [Escherichia coli]|nr:helix-turn-helix transcriptional regulator [Escherichia coli]
MQSPLRNVRKAHGFTLQHVAAGVQVNPATLSRIERMQRWSIFAHWRKKASSR